ncbi:MAG: ATP-grasp domain-containing protein [Cyclobacteriaceae bacterium]
MKVGLVTAEKDSSFEDREKVLIDAFAKRGYTVVALVWTDRSIKWDQYDCLIIRSCWDYHEKIDEFLQWLNKVELLGVPLFNPIEVVRLNHSKRYLQELNDAKFNLIPTLWFDASDSPNLKTIAKNNNWDSLIIKPNIGATAYKTVKLDSNQIEAFSFSNLGFQYDHGFMIQPFVKEIESSGELSIIFFNKEYSHAVLKSAKEGDFRVQSNFGGTVTSFKPAKVIIEQARDVLGFFNFDLLYARVDGILREDSLVIMEVELIEPELFISTRETAARFVDAFEILSS